MRKRIQIKIYTPEDVFIKNWDNASFDSLTKELGVSGMEQCILTLGEGFNYGEEDLNLGNFIEISVSSSSHIIAAEVMGEKYVFRGFISMIEPYIDGKKEGVKVYCLSHASKLANDILKDSATTTLFSHVSAGLTTSSPGSAADIGLMMRAIIDRYRAETTNPKINYTSESIPNTGTTALYSFECKTYKEALDKVAEMAPENYIYYIDDDGIVWFKEKSSIPNHKFTIGLNTKMVQVQRSLEKIKNFLLIWNGETGGSSIFKHYQDDNSITQYGRRVMFLRDYGIADTTSADKIGAKFINENKDPLAVVLAEIAGNYYIENVKPGDTCQFLNFDDIFADIFNYNMIISKVVYRINSVEIQADVLRSNLIDWQEKTSREVEDLSTEGIPASYT